MPCNWNEQRRVSLHQFYSNFPMTAQTNVSISGVFAHLLACEAGERNIGDTRMISFGISTESQHLYGERLMGELSCK
jgi:hypothetical protein